MKCESVGQGDDAEDRRKLGLKYLKSSSKPHLNLIVNLSRWRKSQKILSHDHGHEVEIVFILCFFFFRKRKSYSLLGWTICLDNVFGQFCAAIYKLNLLSCEFSDGEYNKDIDQFIA